ncbi:LysE family translocator [Gulosibacter molinativorax]|uniref:LysE family translocator n=1 Tax=Gulosibacter molinativorax TaxID=256821 RepID=A0ABT7C7W2_9MICO|nr:LysE family translocator [Gulosibacter molinativorax]MDJ1371242.1 LysE family translocator [Gulosibacter molinativorax]QUY63058.1 Lysine Exporter Protein [Gulosibacter molinativorax]
MDASLILQFWFVAILFIITPGADWAYAIASALRNRSPLPGILGMLSGHLVATLVVAAGVGVLVAKLPALLSILTLAGALYLVWMGIGLLRAPGEVPVREPGSAEGSATVPVSRGQSGQADVGQDAHVGQDARRSTATRVVLEARVTTPIRTQFLKGAGVSLLNPKVYLLLLALLPQFTDVSGSLPVGVQMAILGLVHVASCAIVYLVVGYGARRVLAARPAAARVITRVSGAIMIVIALVLVIENLLQ